MAEGRSERLCRCSCLVCLVTVPVCSCGSCFCAGQDSRPEDVAGDTHCSSQRQLNSRRRSARGWSQCLLSGDIQVFSRGADVQILGRQAVGLPLLSIHPYLAKAVLSWHSKWDRHPRTCASSLLGGLGAAGQPLPGCVCCREQDCCLVLYSPPRILRHILMS